MILRGVHVNALTPQAEAFLRQFRPALVKTLDHGPDWAALRRECGIVFLLGRLWLDPEADLSPQPEAAAERLFARMRPLMERWRGVYDAWETPWNERYQRPWDRLSDYARATRHFCALAHAIGVRVAVGNFSVGNPDPEEMALWAEGMQEADYLSVHEYWLPGRLNAPWWAGRCLQLIAALPEDLRRPVIVTECGIDGGLEGRPSWSAGWRAYGYAPERYVADLAAYTALLTDRVLGIAVFCCGTADPQWASFDISSEPAIGAWIASGPRSLTTQGGAMSPRVGEGFQKATALVGQWLEDEIYHWAGTDNEVSVARGERGYATWCRKTNQTVVVLDNGQIWTDFGNRGDGQLRRVV